MKTLLLSMEDVKKLLSMEDVIRGVGEGYLAFEAGKVQQPDIVSLEIPENNGETDIKSCYNAGNDIISVKIASGFYDNGKVNDLPTMIGSILLIDGKNGMPLCIMDGSLITGIRTGAAGAISCKYLARKDSKTAAVLGCGGQARMQIYALSAVMDIETVQVFGKNPEALSAYKAEVEAATSCRVKICKTAAEAMDGADIAISATPSKTALASHDLVKPGMHIVAVGADMAGKKEWDSEIFRGAKIVNDSIDQCVSRGETHNAIEEGIISRADIYGEIGEILAGKKPGRERDDEITIFDTTGMAIQDNVTAVEIYRKAIELGIGQMVAFL